MLAVSGFVGVLFAPDTTGRDLQETQETVTGRRLRPVGAGAG